MKVMQNRVREIRTEKSISQAKLAKLAGVSKVTMISLEKGGYVPSLTFAMRLSEILETPIEKIFYEVEVDE